MLRETKAEDVPHRIAEVASSIAEEGLRYVSDSLPGYRRKRTGTSFSYYDKDGKRVIDPAVIRRYQIDRHSSGLRIRLDLSLANGHIQAAGLDARGRKQYRYHPKWRELQDQNKYEHIMQFAAALPALRARLGDTEAPVDPFMAVSKSLLDVPTDSHFMTSISPNGRQWTSPFCAIAI
jgi:DNA topoisomerase I